MVIFHGKMLVHQAGSSKTSAQNWRIFSGISPQPATSTVADGSCRTPQLSAIVQESARMPQMCKL